jgi:hypothetical protein
VSAIRGTGRVLHNARELGPGEPEREKLAVDAVTMTPAGWYADPVREAVLRWWDGDGWSRHTSGEPTRAPELTPFDGADLPAPDPDLVPAWDLADVEECLRIAALWRDTATRIRGLVAHTPAVVNIVVDDLAPIVIDTRYRAYGWRYPLTGLPPAPERILVEIVPSAPLAPTVFGMRNGAVTELLDVIEELARAEAA